MSVSLLIFFKAYRVKYKSIFCTVTVVGTGELGAFHGFSHKSLRSRSLYKLLACFAEEKLLHEEVHTSWEEAQRLGAAGDLADELRPHLPPGVSLLPEHRARTATSPRRQSLMRRVLCRWR